MSNWLNEESFKNYKDKLDLGHDWSYIDEAQYKVLDEPDTELDRMVSLKAIDTAMSNCGTFSMEEIFDQEKETLTNCYNSYELYEKGFVTLDEESIVYEAVDYFNFIKIDSNTYINVNQIENDSDEYKAEFEDLDDEEKDEYSSSDNVDGELLEKVKEYCSGENEAIYVASRIEAEKAVSKSEVVDYYVDLFDEVQDIPEHLYQWDDENIEMFLRTSGAMSDSYIEVADEIYAHVDTFTYEYRQIDLDALCDDILDEMSMDERLEHLIENPDLLVMHEDAFAELPESVLQQLEISKELNEQHRSAYIQEVVNTMNGENEIEAFALPDLDLEPGQSEVQVATVQADEAQDSLASQKLGYNPEERFDFDLEAIGKHHAAENGYNLVNEEQQLYVHEDDKRGAEAYVWHVQELGQSVVDNADTLGDLPKGTYRVKAQEDEFELPADLIPSSVSGNVDYETALTKAHQVAMSQKDQDRDR